MGCNCGNSKENLDEYLKPLKEILKNYKRERKSLIPILQEAQEAYGYLTEEIMIETGKYLNLSYPKIHGVATFYTQFHLKPHGKNIIKVCMGTACHVKGGDKILEKLKTELNINEGETTDDSKFTLETVACVGSCGLAPVIMINGEAYGRLTPDKIPEILAEFDEDNKSKENEVS